MNRSAIGSLTQREAECLRLVGRLFTDKQIARELCIEPSTVKTLIGRAMRKLDVNSRTVAARALIEHESRPPHWGTSQQGGQMTAPAEHIQAASPSPEVDAGRFEEDRATSDVDPIADDGPSVVQGRVIDASWIQRLALVVATTFIMVIVVIASVPLADAVQRVAERISPGSSTR